MPRLMRYQAERTKLLGENQTLLDNADAAGRDLTAEEQAKFDANNERLAVLKEKIDKEMNLVAEYSNAPLAGVQGVGGLGGGEPLGVGRVRQGRTFARLFGVQLSNDGFRSEEEFLRAVAEGVHHPRLQAALGTGQGATGGYSVPTEFASRWLDTALESEIVRPRADVFPMQSSRLVVPGWDSADRSEGALFGGITAQWIPEHGEIDIQDPTMRKVELTARKLAIIAKASNELVADGIGFEAQLSSALSRATSFHLDYAFLRGDGAAKPLGVLNDPALVVAPKQGGQAPDTITYVNVCDMLARLHPSCVANSIWVASNSCIPALLTLTIPIGVGGVHVPAVQTGPNGYTLLTRPLFISEKLPALGDEGDILLADFSQYAIGLRADVTLEKSGHVYFTTDEAAYRVIVRIDGQGKWNAAHSPRNGGPTLSWCVTLQAR